MSLFGTRPIPSAPGVYIFRDGRKHPIYIGKAKCLADRLGSYRAKTLPAKTMVMLEYAKSLDWIVFKTELEAILCEAAMIRQYKPRYNILLRDDKRFPMILITDEPYPKAVKVRRARRGLGRHFGPFRGATANQLLEIISRRFKIRRCNGPLPKRDRPCIDFDIGRCDAPCVKNLSREKYLELVEKAVGLLSGDVKEIVKEFEAEMAHAAREEDFEKAAGLRDEILALKSLLAKQDAEKPCRFDADAIAVAVNEAIAVGVVISRRNGAVTDRKQYFFELPIETDPPEIFLRTLMAHREEHPLEEVFSEFSLSDAERKALDVDLRTPKKGPDRALLALAEENAKEAIRLVAHDKGEEERNKAICELTEVLELSDPPFVIEAIDIATFAGKDTVGACVQFKNGIARKAGYRMYRIRGRQDSDVDAIAEVVGRRVRSKDPLPDLLLIDGGMGQLLAAHRALGEATLPLISLEKRDELVRTLDGEVITLPRNSSALKLLQQLRDEAHRFGGNYHRKVRNTEAGLV